MRELADFIARRFVRTVESAPTLLRPEEIDPELALELAAAWQWPLQPGAPPSELRDRLRDSGFVVGNGDGDRLSVAGALYLLADPARVLGKAFVEVFRYPGEGVDYDRREEFGGPVQRQVEAAADFVLDELGFDLALLGVRRHGIAPPAAGRGARSSRQRRGAPVLRAGGHSGGGAHRDPAGPGGGALPGRVARRGVAGRSGPPVGPSQRAGDPHAAGLRYRGGCGAGRAPHA